MERKLSQRCFAQEGEDLILSVIFEGRKGPGFYVDVGAFHPFRFSNTYWFYKRGWRGINMDATPGVKEEFDRDRPRDINLHQAVAGERKTLLFYMFNEPALNGFSKELSDERHAAASPYFITRTVELPAAPLAEILDRHLPPNQPIDFLSIDVEGLDLEVLRSNNWDKYRPEIVLVEMGYCEDWAKLSQSPTYQYLQGLGYHLIAKTPRTAFFSSSNFA